MAFGIEQRLHSMILFQLRVQTLPFLNYNLASFFLNQKSTQRSQSVDDHNDSRKFLKQRISERTF